MKTLNFSVDYEVDTAIFLANVCEDLYAHKKVDIQAFYKEKYDFKRVDFHSVCLDEKECFVDLQFCILQKDDIFIVVFKGTEELEDWKTNKDSAKSNFQEIDTAVHSGFLNSFNLFKQTVPEFIDSLNIDTTKFKLYITGHSLGGAIATLFCAFLKHESIDDRNYVAYTYGAPPLGSKEFVKNYKNINLYRIVNRFDPVPSVPKFLFNSLQHIGTLKLLESHKYEHHSCTHYISNLSDGDNFSFVKWRKTALIFLAVLSLSTLAYIS